MAGHSKWANIKHKKAAQDKKRGKLFTKLIREITVAAKMGGEDLNSNPRLRAAVDAGLAGNMTKDTIQRAIKRGAGDLDGDNLEEVLYEGYGPGGVAVMVECLTDNRNRTVSNVRHAFSKCGGNLGTDGSVAYLFTKKGVLLYSPEIDEERLMEVALEVGAEDVTQADDGSFEVYISQESFLAVKDAIVEQGLIPENAELTMVAATQVDLDRDGAEKLIRLIDMLEDLDDVQNVHTNGEVPDDVMDSL